MKRLSDYLGRQIINLAAAKEEGVIINGILDDKLKRLAYFVIVNEENYEETELFAPLKAVLQGTDILYIKDCKCLEQLDPKYIKSPLKARVFNSDGELVGNVNDIIFDDKGNCTSLQLENGEIPQSEVIIASSSIVTVKGLQKIRATRKKLAAPAPAVSETMNVSEATVLPPLALNGPDEIEKHIENAEQPPRIIADYSFLLGRKVIKNIRSHDSKVLIAENTVINDAVVKTASINGKLVELTINSK